ncbi:MAG: 4-phosphopantetheinyl transferase [Burkholderiales bacterium]|nr:4-phosphopantetheinyl transferase [Burkholderiales bacterium]
MPAFSLSPVFSWPEQQGLAVQSLLAQRHAVIGIAALPARDLARQQLRLAVAELLSAALACPPQQLRLLSRAGHAAYAQIEGRKIALSFSHERGLSLAAVNLDGAVGIDLIRKEMPPDWETLARLYLGPAQSAAILRQAPAQQACHFALAWTGLEARLKCCGLELIEWSPQREQALQQKLPACRCRELELPPAYAGTLVLP